MWCHWLVTLTFDPAYHWHFGWLANDKRGQRSKWLTSYYVKISWILGSTWVSKSLYLKVLNTAWVKLPYWSPWGHQKTELLKYETHVEQCRVFVCIHRRNCQLTRVTFLKTRRASFGATKRNFIPKGSYKKPCVRSVYSICGSVRVRRNPLNLGLEYALA